MHHLLSLLSRWRQITLTDSAAILALSVPFCLILGRFWADVAVVTTGVLFLLHCTRTRDWSWLRVRWVQVGLVLWGVLLLSAFFALADQKIALQRAAEWIRWVVLIASLVFWQSKISWWPKASSHFLAILIFAVAIDTLVQYVFGYSLSGRIKLLGTERLTGPFNRYVVGIFLTRLLWLGTAPVMQWAQQQTSYIKRVLLPLGFIGMIALAIFLSGERMAILLTGLSLGIFFCFAKNFRKPLLTYGLPMIIAIMAFIATQPILLTRMVEGRQMIQNLDQTGYGMIFHNAVTAWKQSPLLGVGPKNFVFLCEKDGQAIGYRDAIPETPDQFDCARHPHNPYLEWLADTGLVGLGLFILLIGLWSKDAVTHVWQQRNSAPHIYLPQLCLLMGLVVLLWPLQGNMSVFINWSGTLFWWTIGMIISGLRNATKPAV
ncbi:MAG TPA: O-antigen ligase family protein [Alphaproteobacteria bacterium]